MLWCFRSANVFVCVCIRNSVVNMSSAFNNFFLFVVIVGVVVHYYFTLANREWAHDCSYATAAIECDNRAEMDKLFVWLWRCIVEDNWYQAATKYSYWKCKREKARKWTSDKVRCKENDLHSGAIFNFHKFISNFPVSHKRDTHTHTQSPAIKVIISREIERVEHLVLIIQTAYYRFSVVDIVCVHCRMLDIQCIHISLGE